MRFFCLILALVSAAVAIALLLAACLGKGHTTTPSLTFSSITCADAQGIGPDMEFENGDPSNQVTCNNNICFQTPSSPVCFYNCGQAQMDAGYFSPCWPAPTPSPTPSPTP
jgi:hypothetical protein